MIRSFVKSIKTNCQGNHQNGETGESADQLEINFTGFLIESYRIFQIYFFSTNLKTQPTFMKIIFAVKNIDPD